jgi:hypothetical protein
VGLPAGNDEPDDENATIAVLLLSVAIAVVDDGKRRRFSAEAEC